MWPWRRTETSSSIVYVLDAGRRKQFLSFALVGAVLLASALVVAWRYGPVGKMEGSVEWAWGVLMITSVVCLSSWSWRRLSARLIVLVHSGKRVEISFSDREADRITVAR